MGIGVAMIIQLAVCVLMVVLVLKGGRKPPKLNEQVSDKYKEEAYRLISNNNELSKERTIYKTRRFIGFLLGIALFGGIIYTLSTGDWKLALLIGVPIVIILFLVMPKNSDNNTLFTKIIPSILTSYKSDLSYFHKDGFTSSEYHEAGFEGYDRYSSDDKIKGNIGKYEFELSEVKTENRHTDKDGHTHYVTIFHGVFARVPLDKNFGCFISVINNRIKLFNKDKYVTIDNEAFEKNFDVFTNDKIMAMRLLSPDVTSKLIDIYNETGLYFEFKILNNVLYIRMHTGSLFMLNYSNPKKESLLIGRSLAIIDSVFKIFENVLSEIERFDV